MSTPNPAGAGLEEQGLVVCDFCEWTLASGQVKHKDGLNICARCEAMERGYYK